MKQFNSFVAVAVVTAMLLSACGGTETPRSQQEPAQSSDAPQTTVTKGVPEPEPPAIPEAAEGEELTFLNIKIGESGVVKGYKDDTQEHKNNANLAQQMGLKVGLSAVLTKIEEDRGLVIRYFQTSEGKKISLYEGVAGAIIVDRVSYK